MRAPWPEKPPPGPFRKEFWRSPLRGPWLTSMLGSALLPLIVVCSLTGFLSHAAYNPDLGANLLTGAGSAPFDLYFFDWPTNPAWLYAFTQGLHVISGVAAIPILLAKLWSAMPKLFEWPPVRSPAHLLERLSLAMLVGGSLFVFFTGIFNIQLWFPWTFNFLPAHYYGAFVFLAGLVIHLVVKIPIALRSFRERGVVASLKDDVESTKPEPHGEDTTAPLSPSTPTISRRWLLGTIGAASAGLGVMTAGQVVGGPLRDLALLAPRGDDPEGSGPNDFLVNKTFLSSGIDEELTGTAWRLELTAGELPPVTFSRDDLLAMPQATHSLPIACVEGWSTTQEWTGVPLRDLAAVAGLEGDFQAFVVSLQEGSVFADVSLATNQSVDERTMLALKVNGADLNLDHGFPARLIIPGAPGVHNTKWVTSIEFTEA